MPFSQTIPPSSSPTESKSLFFTSVSLLLSRIPGYHYYLSKFHTYALVYFIGREGNGNPLQYSCLENPMGRGARWAAVHRVAKSWTRLSNFTFTFHFHALEKETATHSCSCLESPRGGGAWWAAVHGVAQSQTRLKRLSSSSSSSSVSDRASLVARKADVVAVATKRILK